MYRCNAFNPFGDSNANIDLNFETGEEDEEAAAAAVEGEEGIPPTFTQKPRIIPNDTGTLVTMKFRVSIKQFFSPRFKTKNTGISMDVRLGVCHAKGRDAVVQGEPQGQGGSEVHQQIHRARK